VETYSNVLFQLASLLGTCIAQVKQPQYYSISQQLCSVSIAGRATLKMLPPKSKTQFVNQERKMQNAIALLNYLKCIALQQLMLRTQVFTKQIKSAKNVTSTLLIRNYSKGQIFIFARSEPGSSD
jgi:hypothetical protein